MFVFILDMHRRGGHSHTSESSRTGGAIPEDVQS